MRFRQIDNCRWIAEPPHSEYEILLVSYIEPNYYKVLCLGKLIANTAKTFAKAQEFAEEDMMKYRGWNRPTAS